MRMIDNVIARNKEVGGTFFDKRTVLYFKKKVLPTLYGNKYFISYDLDDNNEKWYMVRKVLDNGLIAKVGGLGEYTSKADAVMAIRELLGDTVTS